MEHTLGSKAQALSALVHEMVAALIDDEANQSEVTWTSPYSEAAFTIAVKVPSSEIGKVIGKKGRTARAIRTILSAAAMKYGVRCSLDIVEVPKEAATKAVAIMLMSFVVLAMTGCVHMNPPQRIPGPPGIHPQIRRR